MSDPIRLFIFGLGYTAAAIAARLHDNTEWIAGTARSPEKVAHLAAQGLRAHLFDGTTPDATLRDDLSAATHIIVSIPPGDAGDPVLRHHRGDIAAARALRWIGYLSTVGVYGNYGGAWVTERTTPHPKEPRLVNRLKAEKEWAGLGEEASVPAAILRIAGIYGPGRNTFVNLAEGKAHRILKPGQVFNRIHVADIAAAVAGAIAQNAAGKFNLSDDEPAPPQDVVTFAANLMGVAPPPEMPFDSTDLSPMARSFYESNKRVSNAHMKTALGVSLAYPTYRQGLAALWRDGWR